jgi:MYXO-CTERM domain-containing protein
MKVRGWLRSIALALCVMGGVAASDARAVVILDFCKITNNGNSDISSFLQVQVDEIGGMARFTILNNGSPGQFKIGQVEFDDIDADWILTGNPTIFQTSPTNFQKDNSPNLPGGNGASPPFDADYGIVKKGSGELQAGGVLTVRYAYASGKTFADLAAALGDGSFRVGLHVLGIQPQGGSDTYVNCNRVVPEPSTVMLGAMGLGLLGLAARRRKRS